MSWLIFHIASGQVYFTGLILLSLGTLLAVPAKRLTNRLAVLAFILGILAVAISSTATPMIISVAFAIAVVVWLCSLRSPRWRKRAPFGVVATCIWAAGWEASYLWPQALAPLRTRQVSVIGDSLTAGMGGEDRTQTWPQVLSRQHHLKVQDLSHVGDTAGKARQRIAAQPITSSLVIVAIGGNDVLGQTTVAQFERDLDALLSAIASPGRQIIMLELPLPPFMNNFGRAQRRLARKHGAILAPKRLMMAVLARPDSTVDSIHLSQTGHNRMAAEIWELMEGALRP